MIASIHSTRRASERAGFKDAEELVEETEKMGIVAETETHTYRRNDKIVVANAKINEKELIKTVMEWESFKKNLQHNIEKYN